MAVLPSKGTPVGADGAAEPRAACAIDEPSDCCSRLRCCQVAVSLGWSLASCAAGYPSTKGWTCSAFQTFSLCCFVAGALLLRRGHVANTAAFKAALLLKSMSLMLLSSTWSFGYAEWCGLMVFEYLLILLGVKLLCGVRSCGHLILALPGGSVVAYVGKLRWDQALSAQATTVALVIALGLTATGLLDFGSIRRKFLALWLVIATPLSEFEREEMMPVDEGPVAHNAPAKGPIPTNRSSSRGSSQGGDAPVKDGSRYATRALRPHRSPFEDVTCGQLVGRGSFGRVYFGTWLGSDVAVKVIQWNNSKDKEKARAVFEGQLALTLSHPCLVQTFKYSSRVNHQAMNGEEETWIIQEWCDKGTLGNACSTPQPTELVVDVSLDVAAGGAYLHSRGIIHGDLTANNVLLKSSNSPKGFRCKICDFGLARVLEGESTYLLTSQLGTVTHMPPELFSMDKGALKLTKAADVYAAGMLMYQALKGEPPFVGLHAPQIVVRVARRVRLDLPADTPACMVDLFEACTAFNQVDRPTFGELATALREIH